jgi:hypothetical protein
VSARKVSATEIARNFSVPVEAPQPWGTVRDIVRLVEKLGPDPAFADELDAIISADNQSIPPGNPWQR